MKKAKKLKIWGATTKNGSVDLLGDGADNADLYLLFNRFTNDIISRNLKGEKIVDKSLISELSSRGYNIATLKFTIEKL